MENQKKYFDDYVKLYGPQRACHDLADDSFQLKGALEKTTEELEKQPGQRIRLLAVMEKLMQLFMSLSDENSHLRTKAKKAEDSVNRPNKTKIRRRERYSLSTRVGNRF